MVKGLEQAPNRSHRDAELVFWTVALSFFLKAHRGMIKALLLLLVSGPALADNYLIVTNQRNPIDIISSNEATSIFLGVQRLFVSGHEIEIIDHPVNSDIYSNFYRLVTSKSVAQIRSRRASLTFAGVSLPPEVVENDEEVIRWLKKHPNGIGYINENNLNEHIKVLLRVSDKNKNGNLAK